MVHDCLTSTWGEFGWAEDYLERITDIANEYRITHWKPINKPKVKPILNTEDIKKLKIDERLIECSCGKVNYYRFLCFHPRNTNYVILLNHCEEPERFYVQHLIDRFYIDYTTRDIITYRRDYAIKKLKEFEQALSELGDKDEL
jgi:hypothetical protein